MFCKTLPKRLRFNWRLVVGNKFFLMPAILSIFLILYLTAANNNLQNALGVSHSETIAITEIGTADNITTGPITTKTTNNNNTFLTFNNPSLGIGIQYPSDWLVSQHFLKDMFVTQFISPTQSTSDELPAAVTVLVQTLPTNVTSLDEYTDLIYKILALVYRGGINITESNNSTVIAGMIPAYERSFSARQFSLDKDLKIIPLDLGIVKLYGMDDNKIYEITYTAEASKFLSYLPTVQRIFDSFRIEPMKSITSNKTADFDSVFNTFIQPGSGRGYGVYSERPSNAPFKSGEQVELYVEIDGFRYKPATSNETGSTNITANILIFDKQEKQLMTTRYQVPDTVTNKEIDQHHIVIPIQIPESFPSGDFNIRYFIIDNMSGKNFEIDKSIRIAPTIQAFVG